MKISWPRNRFWSLGFPLLRDEEKTMIAPEPQRPDGGRAMLLLLVLGLLVAGLALWGYVRAHPGTPTPAATANPKVLPATPSGGAAPLH
jgi:hypothetical protein